MFCNRVAHGLKKPFTKASIRKKKRQENRINELKKQIAKENKELWDIEIKKGHYPDSMKNK